jgi:hypothetical protein
MQASLVAAAGGAPLAVLPFDPAGPQALDYVAALRQIGPTESASEAGFYAYLAARGQALPPPKLLLYAATQPFNIMPTHDELSHDAGVNGTWLGGGALPAVSLPLPD